MPNWSNTFWTFWSHSFVFAWENDLKIWISRVFSPLKDTLLDTFHETRAPTCRKHVSEQAIVISNWSIKFQTFWSHSSVFPLEKQPKNLNFHSFFTSNKPFVGYFQWRRARTSRKYLAKQGVVMPNWTKIIQTFRSHSSISTIENLPKNLNFQSLFISNRSFGGYFQWNVCTYFQRIYSLTMYSDAKLIKNNSKFLVTLLRFCYRETTEIS